MTTVAVFQEYLGDGDMTPRFLVSIFAVILAGFLFFSYNLLVVPAADRHERSPTSYAKTQPYQPSPLKPTL